MSQRSSSFKGGIAPAEGMVSSPGTPPPSVGTASSSGTPPPSVGTASSSGTPPPSVGSAPSSDTPPPSVGSAPSSGTPPPSVGTASSSGTPPPSVGTAPSSGIPPSSEDPNKGNFENPINKIKKYEQDIKKKQRISLIFPLSSIFFCLSSIVLITLVMMGVIGEVNCNKRLLLLLYGLVFILIVAVVYFTHLFVSTNRHYRSALNRISALLTRLELNVGEHNLDRELHLIARILESESIY